MQASPRRVAAGRSRAAGAILVAARRGWYYTRRSSREGAPAEKLPGVQAVLHGVFLNSHVSRRDHVAVYVVRDFHQDRLPAPNHEIIACGFFPLSALPAGTTLNTSTGVVSGTPTTAGAFSYTIQVSDGFVTTPQSFTVTVTQNHAPVIPTTPVPAATENSIYTYAVAATDSDGDTLNYTLTGAPGGMTISAAGVISWLPSYTQAGSHTLTVRATDPRGLYAEKTFTITVADVRRPITITSTPVTTVNVGVTYSYQVTAIDPDGAVNGYALTVAPSGMTVSGTGLINWSPATDDPAVAVTVRVSDPYQSTDQSYTIDVHGPPAVPVPTHQVDYTSNCASAPLTLTWSAVTAPRSHGVQYAVKLNGVQQAWQSGTSFTFNAAGSYTWYVKAKDIVTGSESAWSAADVFSDTACCDCVCNNTCPASSCPKNCARCHD